MQDQDRDFPARDELRDPFPLVLEVLKIKPVQTIDTDGASDPTWKLRLEPDWDGMSTFWTPEMDDLVALPGDRLVMGREGQIQKSLEGPYDQDDEEEA